MRGAMMVLISRRKIMLITRRLTATCGQSCPKAAPANIATRIHVVKDRRKTPYKANRKIATQRASTRRVAGSGVAEWFTTVSTALSVNAPIESHNRRDFIATMRRNLNSAILMARGPLHDEKG